MSRVLSQRSPLWVRHGVSILIYAVLAVWMTWPLAAQVTTHVPGDGIDDPALAWNLWWIKARLVDQLRLDIFHTGWMFHPIQINLAFYTLTPLNGLLSIPIQATSSLVVTNNLVLFSTFVLSGYGAFLLYYTVFPQAMYTESRSISHWLAAILAGLIYAFAAPKLFYVSLGQFNIASSHWLPFAVLFLWRAGHAGTRAAGLRNGFFAGCFMVFQAWSELTYASFLAIFLVLFAIWRTGSLLAVGMRHRYERNGIASAIPGGGNGPEPEKIHAALYGAIAAGGVFAVGLAPFLAAMIPDLLTEGDFFGQGGGFADVFSADIAGYFLPIRLHPLFGQVVEILDFPHDKGQHIFLGYSTLILAGVGFAAGWRSDQVRWRRAVTFWLLAAVFFWLLTLGPQLRWNGDALPLSGPFALISQIPFFSGNRYPSRYSVMLLLSVAVLAAFGFAHLIRSHDRLQAQLLLFMAVSGLFLFEHVATPLPLTDFRVPSYYADLAQQPGDFAVLELPTGWRNGARVLGRADTLIMMQQWYQTAHAKRRLGGNTSRNPSYKFQYFTESPVVGDLIALMNADRPHLSQAIQDDWNQIVARGRAHAPAVLAFFGVQAVVLHVDHATDALQRYVEEVLPVELEEEWHGKDWRGMQVTTRIYRVMESSIPAPSWEINLSMPEGNLHLAEGWSAVPAPEYGVRLATRNTADLLLNIPDSGGVLELELAGPSTDVRFALNGSPLDGDAVSVSAATTQTQYRLVVPRRRADEIVDRLTLEFLGPAVPPGDLGQPPTRLGWPVGTTGYYLTPSTSLVVRSAGEEVGDFAQIYVNGVDVSLNQRGYNLVALEPNGTILDVAHFDTFASEDESAAMTAWLGRWPDGAIIVGAVADEASLHLTDEAVRELVATGLAIDLRNRFRWSHAFVGVRGAPAATALEEASVLSPASVFLGVPLTGESSPGGVRWIRFTPIDPQAE